MSDRPDQPDQHDRPARPVRDVRIGTRIDLEKMRSVGTISRRTRDVVREGRRADGVRIKATTDELNTTVTEHAKGDRQDVHLRPQQVTGQITKERAAWLMQRHGQTPPTS